MGLILSDCISCSNCSVEDTMNLNIFRPPDKQNDIPNIESKHRKLFNVKTKSDNTIFAIINTPENETGVIEKCIIFCHGNASDIFHVTDYMKILANNLNVYVVAYDYPGYGISTGDPTENGCYESMESIVDYVKNIINIKEENIFLMGQSLGTGIVIDYAYKHNWSCPIILVAPYKSICTIVYDSALVRIIDKFESSKKIKKLKCPVKIFHGEDDELINISHGKKLYKKLSNKTLEPSWLPNTGHSNILWSIELSELANIINGSNNL